MKKTICAAVFAALCVLIAGPEAALHSQPQNGESNTVYNPDLFSGIKYRNIGPSRGGRVTTVTGIASRPSTFYFGSTGGGIWMTEDYGQNWTNISDGFFNTGSIGAIQVSDSDPNIIYVGTGSDGIRSNVISGRGVYKSTDGGESWKFLGLRTVGQIGAVEVHPDNPDLVYVAAIGHAFGPNPDRGVYRTRDGGESWENVLFISDSTGTVDLEFRPDNPREIYASMWRAERKPWTIISGAREGGIYKTINGGDTWNKLTNGLPEGLTGKSDLAVSAADPHRLYVLMEAPIGEGGLYRSDDNGARFHLVSTQANLLDRPFYYTNLDADPKNADILYVNSTRFFQSMDGGKTWQRRSTPHGDNHDMWINPNNPDIFIQSNDGGANVTRDGGKTWSTQHNQPTAELYQVAVDDQFPYRVYAGQQDNSTIMVPSLPPYQPATGPRGFWRAVGGGETGPPVPKPGNHNIVYNSYKGRFGRYDKKTGQEKQYYVGAVNMYGHNPRDLKYRFQRVAPVHVSPHDPDVIYHASQYLHRTTDEGVTWETISPDLTGNDPAKQVISGSPITRDITGEEFYSTIYAVGESPLEKGLIWVGSNDGLVHVTRNDGRTWTNITPGDLPPGGRVQTIEPSPHVASKAYIADYRHLLGDWKPYIYRTDNYGQSWIRLTTETNGIPPDFPTRVIREDPDREGLLYAGTEFGMFVSFDDGTHWQPFQLNLPVTPVTDIKVYRKDLVISTMGRSFWILDNLTPLHQLNKQVAESGSYLYGPRKAYRMRYRPSGPLPERMRSSASDPLPGNPEYPPPGAMIDYYIGGESPGDIKLEILDDSGKLIRAFSSEKTGEKAVIPEFPGAQAFNLEHTGVPRLSKGAGMHRFIWDLRHAGTWHADESLAGTGGPMVIPGFYQVKLIVGSRNHTGRFEVLVDPRVAEDGVEQSSLAAQLSLSLKIRDAVSSARYTAERIRKERGNPDSTRKIDKKLAEFESRLVTAEGRYPTPMLIDQLVYLYSMLDRADQKPGRDAYQRYDELNEMLSVILSELEQIED